MMNPTTMRRRRGGFSLVELLVAMGVIAILISFITPAIVGVRELANVMSCSSNMRSFTQASLIYASGNSERRLPPMYSRQNDDDEPKLFHCDYYRWAEDGDPASMTGNFPRMQHSWAETIIYEGYIDGPSPFACPSDDQALPALNGAAHTPEESWRLSYGINMFMYTANAASWGGNIRVHEDQQGDGWDGKRLRYDNNFEHVLIGSAGRRVWAGPKLTEIRQPDKTILFGERDNNSTGPAVSYWHDWAELEMDRHDGDFPIAWADGSVQTQTWESLWGGEYRPNVPIWEHAEQDHGFARNSGNPYDWRPRRHDETALGQVMDYDTIFSSQSVALPYWQGWMSQPFDGSAWHAEYGGW